MATAREKVCQEYLAAKGAQLWGGPGNLSDEKERAAAAEWLLGELDGLLAFADADARRVADENPYFHGKTPDRGLPAHVLSREEAAAPIAWHYPEA